MGSFWLNEFLQRPESEKYPYARAKALCAQGWMLLWLEKLSQARRPAEESLALYKACNDRTGEIDALNLLGATYYNIGDHVEGIKHYQQALTLSQSLGDIWRQAIAYSLLGDDRSDLQRSFDNWDKAVKLFGEAGDRRSQAEFLSVIGLYRALNGDVELAQKCLEETAILIPLESNIYTWGYLQVTKSLIARLHGDYDEAYTLLQDALVHFEKLGNQFERLWFTVRFGSIALAKGNVKEAREIFIRSAKAFQTNKDKLGVLFSLEEMARLFVLNGNPKIAARLIGWANAMREEINELRPRVEQNDVNKVVEACISTLGEATFTGEYHTGRVMTLNEAVELSLNEQ